MISVMPAWQPQGVMQMAGLFVKCFYIDIAVKFLAVNFLHLNRKLLAVQRKNQRPSHLCSFTSW